MLMVFDGAGNQIPNLQGRWTPELEQTIRSQSTPDTKFYGFRNPINYKQAITQYTPEPDNG